MNEANDVRRIDGYVTALDRALPGPCRVRRELVAEVRDGLRDATAAYRRAGLPADAAELRAVEECGAVDEVAADFRTELAAVQGKRGAMLIAGTMLLNIFAWNLVWDFTPEGPPPSSVVMYLSSVVDWAAIFGGGASLLAIALLVFGARIGLAVRPLLVGMVVASGLSMTVVVVGSVVMNLDAGRQAFELFQHSPAVVTVTGLSVVVLVVQIRALWRIVRVAFSGTTVRTEELVPA